MFPTPSANKKAAAAATEVEKYEQEENVTYELSARCLCSFRISSLLAVQERLKMLKQD